MFHLFQGDIFSVYDAKLVAVRGFGDGISGLQISLHFDINN